MRPALIVLLALAACAAMPASAVYNEPAEAAPVQDFDYDSGVKAVRAAHWRIAIDHLERAAAKHPLSPDVYNLLGYSWRKLGNLERSFRHYEQALELDPDHRGAHEYIGEAWLMRGNAAKAREHLGDLARLCRSECEEYRDLERAIAEFERGDRPGKAAGQ
jgi:Flp pilus assembly protein TadD